MRFLVAAFCLVASMVSTPALAEFSTSQKNALNELFATFIQENPELVREALIDLATRETQARQQMAFDFVRQDEGDPYIGAGDEADIIIYEFSDYNCGYCKRVFTQLQAVLEEDDKVRLTLKEYPILAESSIEAARAAIAANRQGKFPEFHTAMMGWRGGLSLSTILSIAVEAGLDVDQLEADMKDKEIDAIIARTRQAAQMLELEGTPALLIGDQLIPGAASAAEIKQIIALQREKQAG